MKTTQKTSTGVMNHVSRRVFCFTVASLLTLSIPISTYAQSAEKVRTLNGEFTPEENCPVAVTQSRADLDLDPFDAPLDARVYVTYQNISNAQIAAVNFRIRLTDATGKNLGTFRGSDSAAVDPGQGHSQKFKHDRVDLRTTAMQIRVLQVKYANGAMWESYKMQEVNNPQQPVEGATHEDGQAQPGESQPMQTEPVPQPQQ